MPVSGLRKNSYWIFLIIGGLFLTQYWAQVYIMIAANEPVSHKNYWGADVGTYLLLAVLVMSTIFYFYMAWTHRPKWG